MQREIEVKLLDISHERMEDLPEVRFGEPTLQYLRERKKKNGIKKS